MMKFVAFVAQIFPSNKIATKQMAKRALSTDAIFLCPRSLPIKFLCKKLDAPLSQKKD